jgi:methyltransferase
MTWAVFIMGFVTLQRLGELVLAKRHTAALVAKGAREVAADHYYLLVAVHVAWLAGLWWLVPTLTPALGWLAVFILLQFGRVWVLATLGERWTTRIIVLPGAPLITTGPYRYLTHPNYAVVAGEIVVLPLVFGLWWFAVLFSALNAAVLYIRIRAENAALAASTLAQRGGEIDGHRKD